MSMEMYKNIILVLCCAQYSFTLFSCLLKQFMQFGPAHWPFSPNEFECVKTVLTLPQNFRLTLSAQHR